MASIIARQTGYFMTIILLTSSIVLSSPWDWEGVFSAATTTQAAGTLRVCVTSVNATLHVGQAVLNRMVYMRGEIDSATDVWAGEYWFVGGLQNQGGGSFHLRLIDGGSGTLTTYSGSLIQKYPEGLTFSYLLGGMQLSREAPLAADCFRSDISVLLPTYTAKSNIFDGTWRIKQGSSQVEWAIMLSAQDPASYAAMVSSYSVHQGSTNTNYMKSNGTAVGTLSIDNQVWTFNW
jgi:hypothetical protein